MAHAILNVRAAIATTHNYMGSHPEIKQAMKELKKGVQDQIEEIINPKPPPMPPLFAREITEEDEPEIRTMSLSIGIDSQFDYLDPRAPFLT